MPLKGEKKKQYNKEHNKELVKEGYFRKNYRKNRDKILKRKKERYHKNKKNHQPKRQVLEGV